MKVSVILGHPYDKSFNHAIYEVVIKTLEEMGHEVYAHDLYAEKFNPVMTGLELVESITEDHLIENHCKEIQEAEGVVIIHPNWWGQPPAIVKGWVDRIIRYNTAYSYDNDPDITKFPESLLKINKAVVFTTSNTSHERELKEFGDPLETLWKNCTFRFIGVNDFFRKNFAIVAHSSDETRKNWLDETSKIIKDHF